MRTASRFMAGALLAASTITVGACGGSKSANSSNGEVAPTTAAAPGAPATSAAPVDTVARTHHSKLGGALVGAAAGHMLGGHAVAGAAAGALIQHERNKHQ